MRVRVRQVGQVPQGAMARRGGRTSATHQRIERANRRLPLTRVEVAVAADFTAAAGQLPDAATAWLAAALQAQATIGSNR